MSDLRRCIIKSIISPGDYWMTKYYEGRSEVDALQEKLSREIRYSKLNCLKEEIASGEIVAVEHPNNKELYLRGRVKRIFIRNGRYTYEVFLIDHGMHIDVDRNKIETITNSIIRNKEPAAFRVHLYGVQPIQPSEINILNFGETGFKWELSRTWVPSALTFVKRQFHEFDEIFLKCLNVVNNIVVAQILLRNSITETVKSLAELLIDNRFAVQKKGANLSLTSKIAPSSSDGDLSLRNELLPEDLLEIQEIQAKLELVNKWRMEHVVDFSSKSDEIDDTWGDQEDLTSKPPEKKVEEKKPKRQMAKFLMEKLKSQKSNNPGSVSFHSNASSHNSSSSVSSRSSEYLKKLAVSRSKTSQLINQPLCSENSEPNKMFEKESKLKIVVNCNEDWEEDDIGGFNFEETMPMKQDVGERLEPVLINNVRDEIGLNSPEFKILPAGRIPADLPKEIKKLYKDKP